MAYDDQAKHCKNCIVKQFNDLRALNNNELKEISEAKITKTIKKGKTIFEEEEKLNGVFCIRHGVSKLSKLSSNGKYQILKLTTKGDVLGQSSIITENRANLSATALNDMEVCFIPKEKIITPIKSNPEFTMEVLKSVVSDLKDSNEVVLNLSQKSVKQRIATTLIYLKDNFGEDENGYLNLNISREDLASIVGTAIESCIRNISILKKAGLIKLSGKKMGVINSSELQNFINDL